MIELVVINSDGGLQAKGVGPGFSLNVAELPSASVPVDIENMRVALSGDVTKEHIDPVVNCLITVLMKSMMAVEQLVAEHGQDMLHNLEYAAETRIVEQVSADTGLAVQPVVRFTLRPESPLAPPDAMIKITMTRGEDGTHLTGTIGELSIELEEALPYEIPSNLSTIVMCLDSAELASRFSTQDDQVGLASATTDVAFKFLDNLNALRGTPANDGILLEIFKGYTEVVALNINTHSKETRPGGDHPMVVPSWWLKRLGSDRFTLVNVAEMTLD